VIGRETRRAGAGVTKGPGSPGWANREGGGLKTLKGGPLNGYRLEDKGKERSSNCTGLKMGAPYSLSTVKAAVGKEYLSQS